MALIKKLLLRFYLDREPTEFDRQSIEVVATNFDATAPSNMISKFDVECCYVTGLIEQLDALSGFIYARREYDIQDNPDAGPTYLNVTFD